MAISQRQSLHGWFRTLLYLFVVLTCIRVWVALDPIVPEAKAQIPDAGSQRVRMIEQLEQANQRLAEIARVLKDGVIKVNVENADQFAKKGS